MLVAVYLEGGRSGEWRQRLQECLPGIPCRTLDENPPADSVTHAAVWQPPPGWLASFPRLRCVVSLAAGVDGILQDATVPSGVPILRLAGEPLAARMREYVLLAVLALHRDLPRINCDRQNRIWNDPVPRVASERTVGVMGLGVLGGDVARVLSNVGFRVAGWSRRPRQIPGIRCHAGRRDLAGFLQSVEILINLLPLTSSTRYMFDHRLFARLPKGAGFVNVGRGAHVVETDLLEAIDSGQLSGAVLDCFGIEPLPETHPFWEHPSILMTPHVAAPLDAETGSRLAADLIRRFEAGEKVPVVDVAAGY